MRVLAAFVWLVTAALVASVRVAAAESTTVRALLAADAPPPGVVFEIVTGDPDRLRTLMPAVRRDAERLRARFPGLDIAVVSHGSEQFSLLRENEERYSELHSLVRDLNASGLASVQVCGTHASWRDNVPEDFPDYVEVAVAAPARINDYLELGYVLVTP